MPEYAIDFLEFSKILDELLSKTNCESKVKAETESDMTNKYKKLYEASIKLENLKKKRVQIVEYIDSYNELLESVDNQIAELNKLFSN